MVEHPEAPCCHAGTSSNGHAGLSLSIRSWNGREVNSHLNQCLVLSPLSGKRKDPWQMNLWNSVIPCYDGLWIGSIQSKETRYVSIRRHRDCWKVNLNIVIRWICNLIRIDRWDENLLDRDGIQGLRYVDILSRTVQTCNTSCDMLSTAWTWPCPCFDICSQQHHVELKATLERSKCAFAVTSDARFWLLEHIANELVGTYWQLSNSTESFYTVFFRLDCIYNELWSQGTTSSSFNCSSLCLYHCKTPQDISSEIELWAWSWFIVLHCGPDTIHFEPRMSNLHQFFWSWPAWARLSFVSLWVCHWWKNNTDICEGFGWSFSMQENGSLHMSLTRTRL